MYLALFLSVKQRFSLSLLTTDEVPLYLTYSTLHIIFNVHKTGLLYCFQINIRSSKKTAQVPFLRILDVTIAIPVSEKKSLPVLKTSLIRAGKLT